MVGLQSDDVEEDFEASDDFFHQCVKDKKASPWHPGEVFQYKLEERGGGTREKLERWCSKW